MSEQLSDQMRDALKMSYEQVCRSHDSITEFRAKLLALLPIASGTGILLLLNDNFADVTQHLIAVGIFGSLITLGLFLFELRGMHKCHHLAKCAAAIEERLVPEHKEMGAFSTGPDPILKGLIGITWADLIIYPTIIGTWSYISFLGFGLSSPNSLIMATIVTAFFMLTGKLIANVSYWGKLFGRETPGDQVRQKIASV